MLKWNRVLVALIGIPLLIFVYTNISLKGLPLLTFSVLVVGIGLNEFYDMISISGREVYKKLGITMGILIILIKYCYAIYGYIIEYILSNGAERASIQPLDILLTKMGSLNILILTAIIILVTRVFKNKIKGTLDSVAFTLLGIIYVAIFFSKIFDIYFYKYHLFTTEKYAFTFILAIQILVWVSDTSAGIIGVTLGRKIYKNGFTEISPKKSVEGSIGSLFFTGLAAIIILFIVSEVNLNNLKNVLTAYSLGLTISFVSQIGDLIESLFKRECGVKDSGTILMGHGGILDRFDSMLLVLPVVSFFLV